MALPPPQLFRLSIWALSLISVLSPIKHCWLQIWNLSLQPLHYDHPCPSHHYLSHGLLTGMTGLFTPFSPRTFHCLLTSWNDVSTHQSLDVTITVKAKQFTTTYKAWYELAIAYFFNAFTHCAVAVMALYCCYCSMNMPTCPHPRYLALLPSLPSMLFPLTVT